MNMLINKMAIQRYNPGPIRKVYKNLYYDSDLRKYFFIDKNNRREVVNQEAYLLIYIIELLQKKIKL